MFDQIYLLWTTIQHIIPCIRSWLPIPSMSACHINRIWYRTKNMMRGWGLGDRNSNQQKTCGCIEWYLWSYVIWQKYSKLLGSYNATLIADQCSHALHQWYWIWQIKITFVLVAWNIARFVGPSILTVNVYNTSMWYSVLFYNRGGCMCQQCIRSNGDYLSQLIHIFKCDKTFYSEDIETGYPCSILVYWLKFKVNIH